MLNCTKVSGRIFRFYSFCNHKNKYLFTTVPFGISQRKVLVNYFKIFFNQNGPNMAALVRNKSAGQKNRVSRQNDSSDEDSEGSDNDDEDDELEKKIGNIKSFTVKSPRIDLVLKTALGCSRKKIEDYFYGHKICINGETLYKKSINVQIDDKIDVRDTTFTNDKSHSTVYRVEILNIKLSEDAENYSVKIRKGKLKPDDE